MSTTRKDVRQRIGGAAYCGDMIASTALTGSSSAQIVDTTLKYIDSAFVDSEVVVTSGSAIGDIRIVTGWTQSSGILIPDRGFSAAIVNTDTFEIHRRLPATRKNEAINQALYDSKWRWAREIEDETVAMVANQYTYSLASLTVPVDPIRLLDRVEYDPGGSDTGHPWTKIDKNKYTVRNNSGTLTLQLLGAVYHPTYNLRLTYKVRPTQFTTDAGVLTPDNEGLYAYVCARATAILMGWRAMMNEEQTVREHWLMRAQIYQNLADNYFASDVEAPQPSEVQPQPPQQQQRGKGLPQQPPSPQEIYSQETSGTDTWRDK